MVSTTITAVRSQASDYIELTKPRIAMVVLVTALASMWLATGGNLSAVLVFNTLLGTCLASAAAGVLNNYIDRDVDPLMARTRNRAVAAGRVAPRQALQFGLSLAVASFVILYFSVNPLTAMLAMGTIFFYVIIYTLWLKRRSAFCTEIGGIAGAAPPLLGWAAATGEIGAPAVVLFLIMFLWQPPHFWVLAILRMDEYRAAGLPMLPVTDGIAVTKAKMLVYTASLLPATTVMYVLGITGGIYAVGANLAGLVYLGLTLRFVFKPVDTRAARSLFLFSIAYLLIVFTLVIVDSQYAVGQ